MPRQPRVILSDHAVLRYLERILEIDLVPLRERLARDILRVASSGARTFTMDGVTFVFEQTPAGDLCVVTVLTDKMRRATHHRRASRDKTVAKPRQP